MTIKFANEIINEIKKRGLLFYRMEVYVVRNLKSGFVTKKKNWRRLRMNEELREMMIEEMGLGWCPIINTYVDMDCFKHCSNCKDYIEFSEYFDKEMESESDDN